MRPVATGSGGRWRRGDPTVIAGGPRAGPVRGRNGLPRAASAGSFAMVNSGKGWKTRGWSPAFSALAGGRGNDPSVPLAECPRGGDHMASWRRFRPGARWRGYRERRGIARQSAEIDTTAVSRPPDSGSRGRAGDIHQAQSPRLQVAIGAVRCRGGRRDRLWPDRAAPSGSPPGRAASGLHRGAPGADRRPAAPARRRQRAGEDKGWQRCGRPQSKAAVDEAQARIKALEEARDHAIADEAELQRRSSARRRKRPAAEHRTWRSSTTRSTPIAASCASRTRSARRCRRAFTSSRSSSKAPTPAPARPRPISPATSASYSSSPPSMIRPWRSAIACRPGSPSCRVTPRSRCGAERRPGGAVIAVPAAPQRSTADRPPDQRSQKRPGFRQQWRDRAGSGHHRRRCGEAAGPAEFGALRRRRSLYRARQEASGGSRARATRSCRRS